MPENEKNKKHTKRVLSYMGRPGEDEDRGPVANRLTDKVVAELNADRKRRGLAPLSEG